MAITSKSTKAEILKAYDELLQEKEQLEAKVEQALKDKQAAEKRASERTKQGGTAVPVAGKGAVAISAPSTIDQIIETLSMLRPGFGDAVSELSAKLIAEASKLGELHRNVAEETRQLESLHGLEIADDTLALLIQEYGEKSGKFTAEMQQKQEVFEQEIAAMRKAWQEEQSEYARIIKERDETSKKSEQREAAEYTYNLERQRKLDCDQYEQEQKQLEKALKDFEENKKRAWDERETRIAQQEQEFQELQTAVEKFPMELETAVKKAKEEGAAIARRQTKVKTDLWAKEAEGERRIDELKIQSLETTIEKQFQQINTLSAQLDATVNQVQALAMKAIEGSSSAGSLQAVKEIALEQAKTVQKGK